MNTHTTTKNWLQQPILPVVVLKTIDEGLAIAEGLLQGGIAQIEITLRTPSALPAMLAINKAYPHIAISAGTVLSPQQFDMAADHGATLFISPGFTPTLAAYASEKNLAWVPGAATASEMMQALEHGFDMIKFFPAMAAGGPKALAGIAAPLPNIQVIPTGGITPNNLNEWATMPIVKAIGGTWLTTNLPNTLSEITQTIQQRTSTAIAAWQYAKLQNH